MSPLKLLFIVPLLIGLLISCDHNTTKSEPTISSEEIKQLIDTKAEVLILDVRTPDEYETGYLPTAVSLHINDLEQNITSLAPDKDQYIVVYCLKGIRSKKAYNKLLELGYTNIDIFGAISNWPYELVIPKA